jgi:hypothetical protein|tara:strand:+ start:240 stop:725 length:486 start_codon:yes stop_codon:yes gene_type:complete
MVNGNEPRQWEDYRLGTSDNPTSGNVFAKSRGLSGLDKRVQDCNVKYFVQGSRDVDVEGTNRTFLESLDTNRLKPVESAMSQPHYRVIKRDRDDVMSVTYTPNFPGRIEDISDNEFVSRRIALLMGISFEELKKAYLAKTITGKDKGQKINLRSLNNYLDR